MELWIARDKDGSLWLHGDTTQRSLFGFYNTEGEYLCIDPGDKGLFPEVTYEDGPRKVKLELIDSIVKDDNANPILSRGIFECGLSVRAMHCLESADIHTVGDLVQWKRSDLLKLRNFGLHTIGEIEDFLIDHDLTFGMKVKEA
jgi:hypothetical protein